MISGTILNHAWHSSLLSGTSILSMTPTWRTWSNLPKLNSIYMISGNFLKHPWHYWFLSGMSMSSKTPTGKTWSNLVPFQKHQGECVFQILSRLVIRNPIKMTPVLHPGVGCLNDWLVGVDHLDWSETPRRSCVSNFIKIGHQEPGQDDPRPPSWSWMLEWLGGWGWSSWWVRNTMEKLCFKFHQD